MMNAFDTCEEMSKNCDEKKDISDIRPLLGMTKIPRTRIEMVTAVLISGVVLFGAWNWVVRASVLSFGPPEAVWLGQKSVSPGEKIIIHFDQIIWYRLCRSETIMTFQPKSGAPRVDFPVHHTSVPADTGKLPPKTRSIVVPNIEDNQYGPGIVSGHVSSSCWPFEGLPIIAPLHDMPLELVRK